MSLAKKISPKERELFTVVNDLVATIDNRDPQCLIPFFKAVARKSNRYQWFMDLWNGDEDANGGIAANLLNERSWGFSYYFTFNGLRLALTEVHEKGYNHVGWRLTIVHGKVHLLPSREGEEGMVIF